MITIGIVSDRDAEKEEIRNTIKVLLSREDFDCVVCCLEPAETTKQEGISVRIVALKDREKAFQYAEKIWEQEKSALVIYVAYQVEDVIVALGLPFYHIVRMYGLEQDLEAAFRKIGRMRPPTADKVHFTQNGKLLWIFAREILYLESEGHTIRLHLKSDLGTETILVKENLSQCEEKLKGRGFVRIYSSFLVNMYHIRCLEKENVLLDNGERLYVSRRRYPEVKLLLENYIRHLNFI